MDIAGKLPPSISTVLPHLHSRRGPKRDFAPPHENGKLLLTAQPLFVKANLGTGENEIPSPESPCLPPNSLLLFLGNLSFGELEPLACALLTVLLALVS